MQFLLTNLRRVINHKAHKGHKARTKACRVIQNSKQPLRVLCELCALCGLIFVYHRPNHPRSCSTTSSIPQSAGSPPQAEPLDRA